MMPITISIDKFFEIMNKNNWFKYNTNDFDFNND